MLLHLGKAFGIFMLASTFTSLTLLWLITVVVNMPVVVPAAHQRPGGQPQLSATAPSAVTISATATLDAGLDNTVDTALDTVAPGTIATHTVAKLH